MIRTMAWRWQGVVLAIAMCLPVRSHGQVNDAASLRARAWATILAINEQSVRTAEWIDHTHVHYEDGKTFPFVTARCRADDTGRLLIVSEERVCAEPGDFNSIISRPQIYSVRNGVMRTVSEDGVGIVRPYRPVDITPWSLPGFWTGMGRQIDLSDPRTRAEHLLDCKDLEVEEADGAVILTGFDRAERHAYFHRVRIDARTGDVLSHMLISPEWGIPFIEYRMPTWRSIGAVRVPTRVEMRAYEPVISREQTERLNAIADEHPELTTDGIMSGGKEMIAWLEILREVFGPAGVPSRPAAGIWQSAWCDVISVNQEYAEDDFTLPLDHQPELMISEFLERIVDRFDPEASDLTHRKDD